MMITNAIDRILSLDVPHLVEKNGNSYVDKSVYKIDNENRADEIVLSTLSSLVDYIKSFDDEKPVNYLVHIVSPTRVEYLSALDDDRKREKLVVANAFLPDIPFGMFVDKEKMLISLMYGSIDDPGTDKAAVLQFLGTVTHGTIKEYGDDGVSQKATISVGVASKSECIVPSPCILKPYRTFIEIDQPESKFILRMKEGRGDDVQAALFEADGGWWKIEAVHRIKQYLTKELEGTGVLIIA